MGSATETLVYQGVTQRRREELRAALAERGLGEAELRAVDPYVDHVARQAGASRLVPLLFVPALLAGVVALSTVPGAVGLVVALTGACLLAVGAVVVRYVRRLRRARRLRRELLADPEPFVDGDPPRHLLVG